MNEVLRIELEAVRHNEGGAVVVREEGPVDAYGIYIVTDAETTLPIRGCRNAKMFLSRFVTEHFSQEDAHAAAVALAKAIGTVMQNNIPTAHQFVNPAVAHSYEHILEERIPARTFFYENKHFEFDLDKYNLPAHLKPRLKKQGTMRPSVLFEMGMHVLKDDSVINGNDHICVMDGLQMLVLHFSPLVEIIRNNGRFVLINSQSCELVQGAPAVELEDSAGLAQLNAFALTINS